MSILSPIRLQNAAAATLHIPPSIHTISPFLRQPIIDHTSLSSFFVCFLLKKFHKSSHNSRSMFTLLQPLPRRPTRLMCIIIVWQLMREKIVAYRGLFEEVSRQQFISYFVNYLLHIVESRHVNSSPTRWQITAAALHVPPSISIPSYPPEQSHITLHFLVEEEIEVL